MSTFIMKLTDDKFQNDYYLEWSTIVDAPITYGCSLDDFKKYYKEQNGSKGLIELEDRLKRVEQYGISAFPPYNNIEEYFSYNRAGRNETCLTKEQILERYCRNHNS